MHDVSMSARIDDKNSQAARKSSLPHSDAHRNGIYGFIGSKSSDGGKGDDYDEIDQIHDYVRGFAPLPKSAKGWPKIAEMIYFIF